MPLRDPRAMGSQTISPRAFSPTCGASLPGVLRGTSGQRGLGVPDLWLHPSHPCGGEGGDRLHAPGPGLPRRVRVWTRDTGNVFGYTADESIVTDGRALSNYILGNVEIV